MPGFFSKLLYWFLDSFRNPLFYAISFVIIALVTIQPPELYVFKLLQSLAPYVGVGLAAFGGFLLIIKQRFPAFGALLASFFLLSSIAIPFQTYQIENDADAQLSVAHFNILKSNKHYTHLTEKILSTGADVLSIQEVTGDWGRHLLATLTDEYPYHKVVPREDSFGIALFSKVPIDETRVLYFSGHPAITGQFLTEGKQINFVCFHTSSPITPDRFQRRNRQLYQLGAYLAEIPGSRMIIGDLNTVSWAQELEDLRVTAGLLDSRRTYSATYPSWLKGLGIPIDHIFHSEDISCLNFHAIGETSSDHRGIMGIYGWEKKGSFVGMEDNASPPAP